MAEPDDVDGRHKAGHDCGGRSLNSDRYKSQHFLAEKQKHGLSLPHAAACPSDRLDRGLAFRRLERKEKRPLENSSTENPA